MKTKTKRLFIGAAALVLLGGTLLYLYNEGIFSGGLKRCPDAWYDDEMPGVIIGGDGSIDDRQYMLIDGQHYKPSQFNLPWVRSHCAVHSPGVVE